MAKVKDRQALVVRRVKPDTVKAFCSALKERFADPTSGLGKAYLRLLVDEIRLDGNDLVVTGSHRRLAHAIGFMEKRKLGEVPSDVNDRGARRDSNRAVPPRRYFPNAASLSIALRYSFCSAYMISRTVVSSTGTIPASEPAISIPSPVTT